VEETLNSIAERICKNQTDKFTLILNVDPVGEKVSQEDIVEMARQYFPFIRARMPTKPSFPLAVKWLWDQVTTPFFFNMEDDFKIVKDIDVDHMMSIMADRPKFGSLRFCRGWVKLVRKEGYRRKQWAKPIDDMDGKTIVRGRCDWSYSKKGFYLSPGGAGQFSMNPSLMRTQFIQPIIPYLENGLSPERVLMMSPWLKEKWNKEKVAKLKEHIRSWQVAMYAVPLVLEDLGRPWRRKHGFRKPKGPSGISETWEKYAIS
jgi:hypothetical protein